MIFKPVLAAQVMAGTKTETRRPWGGETVCRYLPEHHYAVQPGRGKHAIGRLWVTGVERQVLDRLTDADAVAEGFADREAFEAYWRMLYDDRWDSGQFVWVIRFHLYAAPCQRPGCGKMATKRWSVDMDIPGVWACDEVCMHLMRRGLKGL